MSQRNEPTLTSLSAGLRQAEHLFESLSALSFDEGLKSAFEGGRKKNDDFTFVSRCRFSISFE
jgi:hypothetical protein